MGAGRLEVRASLHLSGQLSPFVLGYGPCSFFGDVILKSKKLVGAIVTINTDGTTIMHSFYATAKRPCSSGRVNRQAVGQLERETVQPRRDEGLIFFEAPEV